MRTQPGPTTNKHKKKTSTTPVIQTGQQEAESRKTGDTRWGRQEPGALPVLEGQ